MYSSPETITTSRATSYNDIPTPIRHANTWTVAKFYKSAESFTCVSNPSITISVAQINDDYCDCPDGSDEPGTSACSYISPLSPPSPDTITVKHHTENGSLALPGFYCKNKGHMPTYVPFTAVNDGICDYELCCDGSDEWNGVGGVKCEDKCKEIGKEWRKQDEARQKAMGTAAKKRKELVVEAQRLRKEVEDRIQTLKTQVEGADLKVKDLEKEFAEVERREKTKVIKGPTSGGKLGTLVTLAKERIAELRETLDKVRHQRVDATTRLQELEGILATFKEEYNPNFNDEGVKRAVRSYEDYIAKGYTDEVVPAEERDIDEMLKDDHENGLNWDEFEESTSDSDVEVLYKFEQYLPAPARDWLDQKLRDLRLWAIDNGILAGASSSSSAGESKAVTDARTRLDSAKTDASNNRGELTKHEEDLQKDYGPDEIFRALKGRCVEQDSGEYTYELCWLDRTTQKPKKGGAHTGMGNFARIEKVVVDDELPADGKGLGSGERIALKYENGQHCWNGPSRSTLVVLACAEKDEVWKVVEEEKCVYRMEVGTPAVCELKEGKGKEGVRDEL
ncbi:hypothetical protein K402DRAFT_62765 [Aulographum hederae CBS 113979]|uniref:Glucosidase 2 subunit beta n=1 Tax=Aulographum hederae CBS 113979 TaxID=1176131 RepID=A0A6G1H1Z6_9PEZI|nr:hypothetical protein K402DRAFT_62765 [Aulographum hederae CBS 113979]